MGKVLGYRREGERSPLDYAFPSKHVLNLHRGINKAHSSLIVQMRTAKIGLRHFLHTSKVPGITDGKCECRRENQTVRHVTTQCRNHSQLRRETWKTLEKREPYNRVDKNAKSPLVRAESGHFYEEHTTSFAI